MFGSSKIIRNTQMGSSQSTRSHWEAKKLKSLQNILDKMKGNKIMSKSFNNLRVTRSISCFQWVHAVRNLQPCVKFAWDYLKPTNLCVIVQSNHLGRHVMHNAIDYMVVVWVMFNVANNKIVNQCMLSVINFEMLIFDFLGW